MKNLARHIREAVDLCGLEQDAHILTHDFCRPAVDFEKKHGLAGISQSYRLPEGCTAKELQIYFFLLREMTEKKIISPEQRRDKMSGIWNGLVALNPVLEKISFDPLDSKMLFHANMGVISAFNTNDIQHYVDTLSRGEKPARKMWESRKYKSLTEAFNKSADPERNDLGMEWAASPATLDLIHHQQMEKTRRKDIPPAAAP